ncbi:ATPase family associated with various cellular activities (AAA) domain-containing protein [Ditylenchus destructor]|nr:ATPase family associated with various cellular activities (AAA) domain-containing protein [Ditylenchus destructor]
MEVKDLGVCLIWLIMIDDVNYTDLFVRLVGFQTPDGSLSEDNAKSITADHKTYLLSSANEKNDLSCGKGFEFQIDKPTKSWYAKDKVKKVIHPDGSLLVICEVESLAAEETFIMESSPNTSVLYPNLQLAEYMEKMWKSQLFTDCTLEPDDEILRMSADDLRRRTELLDIKIRITRREVQRINHNVQTLKEKVKENNERIKMNKPLPYLVSNVIELLDPEETQEEEGANVDLDAYKTKCAVIKTSTHATYFLPMVGLVDPAELKPGDLVGVNKDTYLVLEKLPAEYDSRVKAMEVDERPTEQYSDIGGCDKQITELIEAVVLPMTHKERFINLGIHPPKGVLMYGPPGTGKTMLARAVAAQTKSTFLKLAGPQLVQMFTGDGAKLVRDVFALAKEKAPAIIFIDELDAIGTKRFDSENAGDREVQITMLELLNQLDGFQPNDDIKVIAATNRVDVLDPALLRSGRLDRKIELPVPNEEARYRIMQIHSRKMNVHKDVNFEELARCTDDFNGAQCKAVCVEAGMIALRRDATEIVHEDFMDAILEVQAKKKASLNYHA